MNREKIIIFIWGCLTAVMISMYAASAILNTVKIYKTSGGAEISLDTAGLGEAILILCVYYITKHLLSEKVER